MPHSAELMRAQQRVVELHEQHERIKSEFIEALADALSNDPKLREEVQTALANHDADDVAAMMRSWLDVEAQWADAAHEFHRALHAQTEALKPEIGDD